MQLPSNVQTGQDGKQAPRPVGVPRRFGVSTLMILVAMYGGLFGILELLRAPPILFAAIAFFFTGIGLAQMFLFEGKEPRLASILAGFVLGPLIALGACLAWKFTYGGSLDTLFIAVTGILMFLASGLGGPAGYFAGGLIAGVFLVKDRNLQELDERPAQRQQPGREPAPGADQQTAPRHPLD